MPVAPPPADLDFCDPALFHDPWETYRWLRREAPVHHDERNDLWVLSRHEDVFAVSRAIPSATARARGSAPSSTCPCR